MDLAGFEASFGPDAVKTAMVTEYFKQLPRSYLYFGYTTLAGSPCRLPMGTRNNSVSGPFTRQV